MGSRRWRSHFRHEAAARAVLVEVPGRAVRWGGTGDRLQQATLSSFIATEYNG